MVFISPSSISLKRTRFFPFLTKIMEKQEKIFDSSYFFLAMYNDKTIEHRDMVSITAPKMVITLPENSLPNNNPSPMPPNMPIVRPD